MLAAARAPPSDGFHVIASGEDDGVPFLLAVPSGGGPPSRVALEGAFAWRVSGPRTCVGRWDAGHHVPCPGQTAVGAEACCLPCSGLETPDCVFEPRCASDPASCHCPFGPVPHAVYVAFYGPLAKVGLTQEWRVPLRLREQGADAYFVASRQPDRAAARAAERALSFLYGVPEFRTPREILPQMARPVDWDLVAARAEAMRARLAERGAAPGPVVRVEDHLVSQPLPGAPRRVQPFGRHAGTWLGLKGQNLFYAAPGRLDVGRQAVAAIKLRDLLGRTVTPGDDA
ncbi:MAG: DUF2797 domain-containing protein [bacterium]